MFTNPPNPKILTTTSFKGNRVIVMIFGEKMQEGSLEQLKKCAHMHKNMLIWES
jgi:hypothetical protein